MYRIQTVNKISARGLELFPREQYEVASEISNADAILVRSQDLHGAAFDKSVKAVARAGAGTNNIPVEELSAKGIVVFNTPGANANAVKELVLLSILMSSRPVVAASRWVQELSGKGEQIPELAEKGKSQFVGAEIKGKTLGVVGLGAIGAMVANSAISLGMNVIGYDPFLSVKTAWQLDRNVQHSETLETIYAKCDYITVHVPQNDDTKGMINASSLKMMKNGVRIINLARGGLVNNGDMLDALKAGKVACFVSDFAAEELMSIPNVICLPHLGASTPEAEENCAVMAVNQLRDFLEFGTIVNSVNFPKTVTDNPIPSGGMRLCISHRNVPGMVSKFTAVLGEAQLNIGSMINQNRGDIAYNIIDVDGIAKEDTVGRLREIPDVTAVRQIYA